MCEMCWLFLHYLSFTHHKISFNNPSILAIIIIQWILDTNPTAQMDLCILCEIINVCRIIYVEDTVPRFLYWLIFSGLSSSFSVSVLSEKASAPHFCLCTLLTICYTQLRTYYIPNAIPHVDFSPFLCSPFSSVRKALVALPHCCSSHQQPGDAYWFCTWRFCIAIHEIVQSSF